MGEKRVPSRGRRRSQGGSASLTGPVATAWPALGLASSAYGARLRAAAAPPSPPRRAEGCQSATASPLLCGSRVKLSHLALANPASKVILDPQDRRWKMQGIVFRSQPAFPSVGGQRAERGGGAVFIFLTER